MNDRDAQAAFHRRMEEAPEDDQTRLVYADWLQDRGHNVPADRLRWWVAAKRHPAAPIPPSVSIYGGTAPWVDTMVSTTRARRAVEAHRAALGKDGDTLAHSLAVNERYALNLASGDEYALAQADTNPLGHDRYNEPGGTASIGREAAAIAAWRALHHDHYAANQWSHQAHVEEPVPEEESESHLERNHPLHQSVHHYNALNPAKNYVSKPVKLARPVHDRVAEDVKSYRQTVRPNMTGKFKALVNTVAEHPMMHDWFVKRGLKVAKSTYSWYDADTHTLHHWNPEDKSAVVRSYLTHQLKPTKLARKSDPAEAAFTGPIWDQWRVWRKHVADNERRGLPNVYENMPPIMDDTSRLVFADWLKERDDPREAIVRGHVDPQPYQMADGREGLERHRSFGRHPETAHTKSLGWYNAIGRDEPPPDDPAYPEHRVSPLWSFERDLMHPGNTREWSHQSGDKTGVYRQLPSVVWRHAGITTSRRMTGVGRFREHPVMFHGAVTIPQYYAIADTLPEKKRAEWHAYAEHNGWARPTKLARNEFKQPGAGQAARTIGSANHKVRVQLAQTILSEAGLQGRVKAVLSHEGATGIRPAVSALLQSAHPAVARFAAAWIGMLTGEPRVTVFHPGAGEDVLHIVDTPHPTQHVGEYLKRAGVPNFSMESRGTGTRAFIVNPMDLIDVETAARGLQGTVNKIPGTAVRLGAGTQKDARAAYRQVIEDSEKEAGSE